MSKKIRVFLLACVLMLMFCMGITAGASEEVSAEVKGHSLTITDTGISVNFYVDIQGIAQNNVEVKLNNKQVDIPAETKEVIMDAKAYDCYVFTQSVVAKEMDEKVSLNIVSGDKELVKDSYCVNDYVAEVQTGGYAYNFENLANAMTYYGEFAEVYFGYKGATSVTEQATSFISNVAKKDFDNYAMTVSTMPEGLEFYGTQLNLNSEITLRLLFKVAEGKQASSYGNFTANNTDLGQLKTVGNYYCVDIEGIGADDLGKGYVIKCGNEEIITNCSVLTYARAVVNAYSAKEDATVKEKNLLNVSKALYLYNQKAVTYVAKPATDVKDIFCNGTEFYADPECTNKVYLTANKEATTVATGNTEIISLSQLNGSRTKGYSVWMKEAYDVSEESITGPYVIRRYTGNEGNVLNVTGTATVQAKIDGSCGTYVAQYLGNQTTNVTIAESEDSVTAGTSLVQVGTGATFTIAENGIIQNSHVTNGEVYISDATASFTVSGNAKTGVITGVDDIAVVADDLATDAEVVFPNHSAQTLSGIGVVDGITLLNDGDGHFGAINTDADKTLRLGSIICVCGANVSEDYTHTCPWATDGVSAAYDIAWTEWDNTRTRWPKSAGYYYVSSDDLKLSEAVNQNSNNDVRIDLNGKTVTITAAIQALKVNATGATTSISDSKGNGKVCVAEDVTINDGAMVWVASGSFELYGGTLDCTNAGYKPMRMGGSNTSYIYGGTIIPSTTTNTSNRNTMDCGSSATVTITGGTVYGEVQVSKVLNISGSAKVGVPYPGNDRYGIVKASATADTINYDLTEGAHIVLDTDTNITVSTEITADSKVSGIDFLDNGKDGHYGLVRKSDGTVAFATKICACGANVSDESGHTCEWMTDNSKTIDDIYGITWIAYNTEVSKEMHSTKDPIRLPVATGYYYLNEDMTLDARATVEKATVCLDLNGHTATKSNTAFEGTDTHRRVIALNNAAASYTVTDSSADESGQIVFADDYVFTSQGAFILMETAGSSFTLCGGTIDMSNIANAYVPISVKDTTLNVHNGTIIPAKDVVADEEMKSNCIYLRGTGALNATGGSIYGEVIIASAESTLTLEKDAKVGLKSDVSERYAIKPWLNTDEIVNIACDLNTNANIVLAGELEKLTLSGTVDESVLTIPSTYYIETTTTHLLFQKKNNE